MAGHLFIVRGDLRRLSCDGWLLPSDGGLLLEDVWVRDFPPLLGLRDKRRRLRVVPPSGPWRTFRLDPWPEEAPPVWVTDMGAGDGTPVEWYMEGVRAFVAAASEGLGSPRGERARPLLALPLVGTGGGGAARLKGEVVDSLLDVLLEEVRQHDLDLVLVTHQGAAFAAAQDARKNRCETARLWPELSPELRQAGVQLAESASRGELVVFMGAGVSREAGLPDWKGLLAQLASRAGLEDQSIQRLNLLDQARVVERRLEVQGVALGQAVAELVDVDRHSLTHALLAGLPIHEAVTLNYDKLFEAASLAAGHSLAVLPYEPATRASRWLLKMHGCVDHWQDIVLRREDYLRYAERRMALSGIVQSLLITRRMLFVGFSLNDDNFHTIVDSVRKALGRTVKAGQGEDREAFGTALLLSDEPLLHELWEEDLELVAMSGGKRDTRTSARKLQIFLDFLLSQATSHTAHLLDPSYRAVLTPAEQELRDALERFRDDLSPRAREAAAWDRVERLLREMGG